MNFANEYNNNNANSSRRTYGSIIDNIVSNNNNNNNNNNNTQRGEEYMDDPFAISEEEEEDDNNSDADSSDHSNNAIFNLMSFSDSRIRIQGLVKKATRTPERKKRSVVVAAGEADCWARKELPQSPSHGIGHSYTDGRRGSARTT